MNAAVFDSPTTLASHVLSFMVRGVASDLKYILGYFSIQSLTSFPDNASFLESCVISGDLLQSVGVCSCKRWCFLQSKVLRTACSFGWRKLLCGCRALNHQPLRPIQIHLLFLRCSTPPQDVQKLSVQLWNGKAYQVDVEW